MIRRRTMLRTSERAPDSLNDFRAADWGADSHAPCRFLAARERWLSERPGQLDPPVVGGLALIPTGDCLDTPLHHGHDCTEPVAS